VLGKCMQFPGRQVSAPTHANKTAKMSRERGPRPFPPRLPERVRALSSTTDPSFAENPRVSL
jgi:hypothetical protein